MGTQSVTFKFKNFLTHQFLFYIIFNCLLLFLCRKKKNSEGSLTQWQSPNKIFSLSLLTNLNEIYKLSTLGAHKVTLSFWLSSAKSKTVFLFHRGRSPDAAKCFSSISAARRTRNAVLPFWRRIFPKLEKSGEYKQKEVSVTFPLDL